MGGKTKENISQAKRSTDHTFNTDVTCEHGIMTLRVTENLIQLSAAVYGLVNAPSSWRKTIVRGIENLGYRRSYYDPCIFCFMDESGPQGHILIEVDDLATHGNPVHAENMTKLQKTFKFGKRKSIYNSECDYAGRTVIQDQSYGFQIHQAKFVREPLSPIAIKGTSLRQEIGNK